MTDFTTKYFFVIDHDPEPEDSYVQEALNTPEPDYSTQEVVEIPGTPTIVDDEVILDGKAYEFRPLTNTIVIDGEIIEYASVEKGDYYGLREVSGYYVAEDDEQAGTACSDYYREMAEHDPEEFTLMVGKDTLVKWALGQSAGPGYNKVRSLSEWLDLVADYPEEHLASYDGEQRTVDFCSKDLIEELGYIPTLAYRKG